jgi:amino acid transporter
MATADVAMSTPDRVDKGLKGGALGLLSSVVVGVASVAPAYSIAATLFFVVALVGAQTPIVVVLAFVPMLFISIAYSELNKADPDCGTSFTWATRAFGPKVGWYAGGWGVLAADILVMASLAQIAGQYGFLLFGADKIGHDPTSGWVLLVGILWIAVMTYICYRGIEISANFQKVLLSIELTMLFVFSITALVKVGTGNAPAGHLVPKAAWFNPFDIPSFSLFIGGIILMIFIYWGWDTTVSINEETEDPTRTPGRAAIISTILLLATYVVVTMAAQSFAGLGTNGIGLGNENNANDVLSVLGHGVFGHSGTGTFFTKLLILMVLSSAAASTQTTILPTARSSLAMGVYRAIPSAFARIHPRYLTPSVSTAAMGLISALVYLSINYMSAGNVISDSVTACGIFIALYYGITGFACVWYYRKTLTSNARDFVMQGVLPFLGGAILFFVMGWSFYLDYKTTGADEASYTFPHVPGLGDVGGVSVIVVIAAVVGIVLMVAYWIVRPAFFRGEVLNRFTPTILEEDVGRFGQVGVPGLHSPDEVPPDEPLAPQPPAGE